MTADEKRTARCLAMGRIFRLGSRPTQPGDAEAYEDARHAFRSTLTDEELASGAPAVLPAGPTLQRHRIVYGDS